MSTNAKVLDALTEMEDDIYAVERFAMVLNYIADSPCAIQPECLNALANPLMVIGSDLRERYRSAFEAAGGQA